MFHQRLFNTHTHILIINSDGYGITPSVDVSIRQLISNRKILSLSAVVNQEYSVNAATELVKLRDVNPEIYESVSIGFHLNLTQGQPESQIMRGTQYVHNGKFTKQFLSHLERQEIKEGLIADEFRQQVKKFIRLYKRRPSHVDSHHHVHLYPSVARAIAGILSQFGIYKIRILSEKDVTSFGQYLCSNINKVRCLYESNSVIWPDIFIATEDADQLKAQRITDLLTSKTQKKVIELMCRPTEAGSQCTSSSDRLKQKQPLQSETFINLAQSVGGLSSYFDLSSKRSIQNRPKLLIYSKLELGTGNYTTTQRLKSIFQKLGFKVYTWSVQSQIKHSTEVEDLQRFLISFGITLILGINASRSAKTIYEATHSESKIRIRVPYILVIAGTDANYTFQEPQKYEELANCLGQSQCIVSISKDMTTITDKVLKQLNIEKRIYTIVQSSSLGRQFSCLQASKQIHNGIVNGENNSGERKIILFPTSFRRIKCVEHVFKELNQLILQRNIEVHLLGPIIERSYYDEIIGGLGKIKYLGTYSSKEYSKMLASAVALINCSETEGMSCSILEALEFGVPVVARDNSGNRQLINHEYNGLIYTTPEDFTQSMERILDDTNLRQLLIKNGKTIFAQNYSLDVEIKKYQCMIQQEIFSKILNVSLNHEYISIFNQPFVHNTSEINNQLYMQIQPNIHGAAVILDFGCGTSVFSLLYLLKANFTKVVLYLVDITDKIIGNAVFNCRQSSLWDKMEIVAIRQSKFLKKIDKNVHFDAILFNPPQTPFQNAQSRLDKNGGIYGIKFYECVLKYFASSNNKTLYLLHSYLAWPNKVKQLYQLYKLKCSWRSEVGVHKITKQDYDSMESGLSSFILKHWQQGRADISLQENQFSVPAEIQLITKQ